MLYNMYMLFANNVFIFFFRRVLCKQFLCRIFTAAIFKPGVHEVGNLLHSFAFLCFLGHYLHFTFFAVKKKTARKDAKPGKLLAVRGVWMGKSGARAISQSDSRI